MIITRFAPSPTGYLHIGGVRTALFSWAFARKNHGKFILRIEDTDIQRSTQKSINAILDGLNWINLNYDEGPFYQSKRIERYKEVIKQLLDSNNAYYCYCSKEELEHKRNLAQKNGEYYAYDRTCRDKKNLEHNNQINPVVRFKMPISGNTNWNDLIKGTITINNNQLEDLIIARTDGMPTYNFCVVVDDFDMGITHVIRGDDHVNNTPKQINILKALNVNIPEYAHLPMILNENGSKMSKRTDAVSITDYANLGILPEALLNYLTRLGWGHKDSEYYSIEEFIEWFDLKDVSPSPSRFNKEKLLWLNSMYIKDMNNTKLSEKIIPILNKLGINDLSSPKIEEVLVLVKDRASDLNELAKECSYFYKKGEPPIEELTKFFTEEDKKIISKYQVILSKINEWTSDNIHDTFKPFCDSEKIKMRKLGMPLRIVVCGTTKTPSIDKVLALLGKEKVLERIIETLK